MHEINNRIQHRIWDISIYNTFQIQTVYNVLPIRSKCFSWGKVDFPAGSLGLKKGTLEHILSCFPKALGKGCSWWHHYQVLKDKYIASAVGLASTKCSWPKKKNHFRHFWGESGPGTLTAVFFLSGLLAVVQNWVLKVSLDKQLKFPEIVATTTKSLDLVLCSEASKQVIILKLTVPCEVCIEEANERKGIKYIELVEDCQRNDWWVPIEVGIIRCAMLDNTKQRAKK